MTVYFIGAGPGDPELITVKGQRLIRHCPVIIYAGSLVPAAVLEGHQAETVINSAELHLEQIIAAMRSAHEQGKDVARVHSGDPSLYGAIGEQIRHLQALGIDYQIIPGVTATAASAALLGCELTLPQVAQTRDSHPLWRQFANATRRTTGRPGAPWQHPGDSPGGQAPVADRRRTATALMARTARWRWSIVPHGQTRTGCAAPLAISSSASQPRIFAARR